HFPAARIDADESVLAESPGGDELCGLSIEVPENAELAQLDKRFRLSGAALEVLEELVHVGSPAGRQIVVPVDLAAVCIERTDRVRAERVASGAAGGARPRLRLRGRPLDEIERRIVAAGNPRIGSRAIEQRQIAPRITARLAGTRDRRGPPQLFSGARVV